MNQISTFTAIPREELEIFKQLKNLKVIFDVGSRDDIDYALLRKNAVCHLFEPHPEIFDNLKKRVIGLKNVRLNNFGLNDVAGEFEYHNGLQAIAGSSPWSNPSAKGNFKVRTETLDWYVKKHRIKRIDFLKMDTEGSELNILKSGKEALKITRFLQVEHWNNIEKFEEILNKDFCIENIGYRNLLCINHHLVPTDEAEALIDFIKYGNYAKLI